MHCCTVGGRVGGRVCLRGLGEWMVGQDERTASERRNARPTMHGPERIYRLERLSLASQVVRLGPQRLAGTLPGVRVIVKHLHRCHAIVQYQARVVIPPLRASRPILTNLPLPHKRSTNSTLLW